MSSIAGWFGSGAALIMIGAAWVMMRYHHHLPGVTHPILRRLVIIAMYAGGVTLALMPAGQTLIHAEMRVMSLGGGVQSGLGHAAAVIAGLLLAVAVIVALIWAPELRMAWVALGLPLVLALSGGHLHQLLTFFPGQALAEQVSHWLGG